MYEVNGICPKCGILDYDEVSHFTYCPDCGKKIKLVAHCLECGIEGTENKVHQHHCICKEHKLKYKHFGGLFGEFECPKCRKIRLEGALNNLKKSIKKREDVE